MNTPPFFIIIDDDPFNNKICNIALKKTLGEVDITAFTEPEAGYEYIKQDFSKENEGRSAILLLDINMPTMTGWEFLEEYELLDDRIKEKIKVFILSSSVDDRDKERASHNPYVQDYLVKPLSKDIISRILAKAY